MLELLCVLCILIFIGCFWAIKQHLAFGKARASLQDHLRGHPSSSLSDDSKDAILLICKPSALANYLIKHCTTFHGFWTSLSWTWNWTSSPFLQTIFNTCWPVDGKIHFIRDCLQMSDEGLVALDWAVPGTALHRRRRASSNSTAPVLVIIPNSFGRLTRNTVKLCETALDHGYLPVVFNRRSQNGTPLSTPRLQQFGDPSDLREAIRYIRYRHPSGRLYAVSESTGSGLLLSYLGECGSSSYMTAAACISPIFRCQDWFESGPPWIYHWPLLLYQKICLSRYTTALSEIIHMEELFSSCSLRVSEEAMFCHSGAKEAEGSYSTSPWESYWERNDPLRDVDEVAIPVLCLCSRDDPIRGDPSTTVPFELFETNPHFFLLLTSTGGHCGFISSGSNRDISSSSYMWSHQALLEFFHATSEFFAAEERTKLAVRRRGLGVGSNVKGFPCRSVSICKKEAVCSHNIHDIYNWQRSYTR
ncbi:ABH15 protein, partial [Polypterus senegalus]